MTGNPGWAMQAAEATISLPLTTATTAVGQRLGASPAASGPSYAGPAGLPATGQNLSGFTQLPPLAGGSYPGSFLDLLGGQAGVLRSIHGK